MPPQFLEALGNWITGGRSGNSGKEEEHDSQLRDPACDNPDFNDQDDDTGTKKRKPAPLGGDSRKRVDSRSAHARRLEGDYEIPANAVRIQVPGAYSPPVYGVTSVKDTGAESRMAVNRKPGAGRPWKPLNTLDKGIPHAPQKRTAYSARDDHGDGYGPRERWRQPTTKKQKTSHPGNRELAGDPITTDDEEEVSIPPVISVNGRNVQPKSQYARRQGVFEQTARKAPFEGNEHKAVDQLTQTEQPKARRRQPNGNRSSQASSSRASPAAVVKAKTNGTSEQPFTIDDDTSQEISQKHAKPPSSGQSDRLPDPRNLMNGVNEIGFKDGRRTSDASVEIMSTNMSSQMAPPSTKSNQARRSQHQANGQAQRKAIHQGFPDSALKRPQGAAAPEADTGPTPGYLQHKKQRGSGGERRMSETFIRDVPASQHVTNGASSRKGRMKADSGRVGADIASPRDSLSSADELNGPATVGSGSPEKRPSRAQQAEARTNGTRARRSGSPSDLKKTQFTRHVDESQSRASGATHRNDDEEDSRTEIPLAEFCATSKILGDDCGEILLKYDARDDEFVLYRNGELQVVPGGQRYIRIGRTEAREVSLHNGSPLVFLKGSSELGGISNGRVCIKLEDARDLSWFFDRLMLITNDQMKVKNEPLPTLQATYTKQAKEIFQWSQKRKARAMVDGTAPTKGTQRRNRSADEAGDEEIRYETETTRPTRRRGLRGEDIIDDELRASKALPSSRSHEESPFQDGNTRRSMRQSKPTKRRSPSPVAEKWTKINKPKPWAHSVVYPDQGARRVTVDFEDLAHLDEGEFLNDNVISFALRRIEEQMAPEDKEKVHFFNTFFYTALTTKNGKKVLNYDAVKRWTKSKDLLGCDYVVVPINADLHWFVAIICNLPNLPRRPAGGDDDEEGVKVEDGAAENGEGLPSSDAVGPPNGQEVEQPAGEASEGTKEMRNLSLSDGEGRSKVVPPEARHGPTQAAERQGSPIVTKEVEVQTAPGRKGKKRAPPSVNPDKPAIITLDSFGSPHTAEIRNLKDYIILEAETKREIAIERTDFQGVNAKDDGIPTQKNFCDCGVYLVGYVEQFAKNPREFATKALQRTLGHEAEFKDFVPSQKRDEIRQELLDLQTTQETERKAKKADKKANAAKTEAPATESAAATPKPESKPASKAASLEKEVAKPIEVPPAQRPRRTIPQDEPPGETEAPAPAESSQDKDLEVEVPRAWQSPSRPAQSDDWAAQSSQEEGSSEEVLDVPGQEVVEDPLVAKHESEPEPSPLLDGLHDYLAADSQQTQERSRQAAQQTANTEAETGQRDPEAESSQPTSEEEQEALDDGPDKIRNEDVVDLGDSGDERRRSEIPDSQEQWQRQRQRQTAEWTGKRTTFD